MHTITRNSLAFVVGLIILTIGSSYGLAGGIRLAHLSPDAPEVYAQANGATVVPSAEFGDITEYLDIPSVVPVGTYDLAVIPTGDMNPVVEVDGLALYESVWVTVAAIGELAGIQPFILFDDITANPQNARVRFVHLSPNAPAVDVLAVGVGNVFEDIEFKEVGDYIPVPPATYDFEVRLAGTSTSVLPVNDVVLSAGQVYTIWAIGLVNDPQTPLAALKTIDFVPEPASALVLSIGGVMMIASRWRRR